ncbi:protein ENHANCED DOWNY MILDEW 2-like [Bidens hawaiensis]|uniref:protein ENHANCED DOWNY MILDEW 2-like n=1 Tax=Bidens hawaiensis TaxID=980011 RepID=UPI00404B00A8
MASSDDEGETFPDAVSDYYFNDKDDESLSFSKLPIQWNESESSNADAEPIFLGGKVDNGLGRFYQQVKAWKYDISTPVPEISVLAKDNHWIKLKKPRKSYETLIRSILISVHCLCFCKSKPEASGKSLREHLSKVFSLYEIRPSEKDLKDHISFIREAIKRDDTLGKSKFLAALLENPRKNSFDEDVTKPSFIIDDINGDVQDHDINTNQTDDSDSDGEDVDFDVCAICDNGGKLTCCEGKCFRSFHGTPDSEEAQDSNCESLCLTSKEMDDSYKYQCENCQYSLHQCAVCGELGCSDKSSNTEVFRCSSASCGHFYHPKCVAKLLKKNDKTEQQTLKEKIAAGEPFLCPAHKCAVCRQTENEKVKDLQFAICRRCPKSYHRKCLPREIKFEDQIGDDDDDDVRAWDGLLAKSRVLIYCLEHEIDPDLATPARTIKFRNILIRNTVQPSKKKPAVKVTGGDSVDPSKKKSVLTSQQSVKKCSAIKPEGSSKKRAAVSSGSEPLKKKKLADGSKRSMPTKVKKPNLNDGQPSLGSRLFDFFNGTESDNVEKDETSVHDNNQTVEAKPQQTEVLPPLDDESKQRIMALVREASSSVKLEEVKKYHQGKVPSTHAHSSRVDKLIKLSKVEGSVEALNVALKKLDEGCSVQDAMAVCDPSDIDQLMKWKEKLRVYLAPFLHGKRYTSFGRHFTKVEKLEKIVDKLHWYIEDGDTVVDFCCGANDFSCLMKKKLDETGKKKCSYKNFDITRPKNDFNFEKRDWMTVTPRELPSGSQLVMGLNPPFGTKAALANKFIDHALKFKPKLLVLIVPPETERLDSLKRVSPYDMIWEDVELLAGRSFYLPGSADVNDKQMDQWNVTPPPLYLWSRPNWTTKHKSIAQKQGHIPLEQLPTESAENETKSDLTVGKVDKVTIEDSLSVEKDFKTTYKAKKLKNKKRKKESPYVPEAKRKQIIEEKGNGSSSKKPRYNQELKKEEPEAKAQKLEEARVPVETQKLQNKRTSVEAPKRETTQAPVDARKLEKQAPVEAQKHETRAPVEAQKLETRAPAETQKQETRAPAESQKNETRVPIGAQKPELTWVPSREIEVQKHEKSRAPSRETENQKPRVTSQAPSRETEVQKPELTRVPSREIEVPKHEISRAPSREIEDQKPRVTYRAPPSREFEDQKPRATAREMETSKQEKTRVLSREFEAQKYENKRSSPHTREDKVHDTLTADFSFVDVDQRSDGKYKAAIDESTFSLQNDFGPSYDDYLVRKYGSPNEESYLGSTIHRRLDAADPVVPPGFSARPDHLQYPPGYERVINRAPYFDEMGARSGGGYSMTRHEAGLTRFGSTDATPYNRTSTSTTQRYAPRLDELNHVRVNNVGRSEIDEMNMSHLRMAGLGRPEPPMGSRGVGGYRPPINGPGARMDSVGFAPGPYRPYQH